MTTRKRTKQQKTSMAASGRGLDINGEGSSLLIDSIPSLAEESEVNRMLELEVEVMDDFYPITSTQMITGGLKKRSVLLSPIMSRTYQNPSCNGQSASPDSWLSTNNRFSTLLRDMESEMNDKNVRDNNQGSTKGQEETSLELNARVAKLEVGRALQDVQSENAPLNEPVDPINEGNDGPSQLEDRSNGEVGRAPHNDGAEAGDSPAAAKVLVCFFFFFFITFIYTDKILAKKR